MFIFQQLLFYLSIIFILFIPGYLLLLAIFGNNINKKFFPIENLVLSFGLSLVSVNFIIIFLGKLGFLITTISLFLSISLFLIICYLIYILRLNKNSYPKIESDDFPRFSKKQKTLIILILFLTIFLKTVYLKDAIFPTSTDLGHHMYWSKLISETGTLPDYQKLKIFEIDNNYTLETAPIADFIIGEHLIFSAVNLLSGVPFISYFPTLVLFLINIISILSIFILTIRLFSNKTLRNTPFIKIDTLRSPTNIAIVALFIVGPLYALSSPQAKFVSGGVIGNIIGNLLIPLSLYLYFRAFKEKNSWIMFLALIISAGMFYIHHLSSLIFIFIFIFIFLTLIFIFTIKVLTLNNTEKFKFLFLNYLKLFKNYIKTIFATQNIIFIILISIFVLYVYTPSYLNSDATGTAIGAPSKATRAGLTLTQFKYAVGEPRLALGLIGLILLAFIPFKNKPKDNKSDVIDLKNMLTPSLIIGWALSVSIMTLAPQLLYINIPSGRVANYANFPFIIASSFALVWIFYLFKNKKIKKLFISKKIIYIFFTVIILTLFSAGFFDNSQTLTKKGGNQEALQTFHASNYLSKKMDTLTNLNYPNYMLLKDHNYLKADAWIKLFFMKDYSFPLSRAYFKRYEDPTKPREMCTLWMISSPSSKEAAKCYQDTKTKFIIVNPKTDSIQFEKSEKFWKIYSNNSVEIFYRK